MSNYLENLTVRLTRGLSRTTEEFRQRHSQYLVNAQGADGGFAGREGGSDLYYTSFALRALACLGSLGQPTANRAASFLRARLMQPASVVDFMSLLYAARLCQAGGGPDVLSERGGDWPGRVASVFETFRKSDGGYAKATDGASGSTYHTFLVALCYELIGLPIPAPDRIVEFVRSRRRDDGGFVEVGPARRGGTNPTAAALGLLLILDALDDPTRTTASDFLCSMQSADGGLRANGRAPLADLLSTFTGLLTLSDLGAADRVDLNAIRQFIEAIEAEAGGYHGGLWDEATDVEYTFYGLGAAGLLHLH